MARAILDRMADIRYSRRSFDIPGLCDSCRRPACRKDSRQFPVPHRGLCGIQRQSLLPVRPDPQSGRYFGVPATVRLVGGLPENRCTLAPEI